LDYLKKKNKPFPEKNIFLRYLYGKCNFTRKEVEALKKDYRVKISWLDWILTKLRLKK